MGNTCQGILLIYTSIQSIPQYISTVCSVLVNSISICETFCEQPSPNIPQLNNVFMFFPFPCRKGLPCLGGKKHFTRKYVYIYIYTYIEIYIYICRYRLLDTSNNLQVLFPSRSRRHLSSKDSGSKRSLERTPRSVCSSTQARQWLGKAAWG